MDTDNQQPYGWLAPLWVALNFLTTLPTPAVSMQSNLQGQSLLYYPFIGFIIGVLLSIFAIAGTKLGITNSVLAILVLISWVAITGALHLDGLADSADAWLGGLGDAERTLKIMKDPHAGAIAVIVLILILLLKFALISSILDSHQLYILMVAPVIARANVILLLLTTPYVRENGLGSKLSSHLPRKSAKLILLITTALLVIGAGLSTFILIIASIVFTICARQIMIKRISGTTGDTTGALIELQEVLMLIMFVAFI